MMTVHIYGSRVILLLFCDHQDTESESCEIEMRISQQIPTHKIFNHKKILKALWANDINTLQYGRNILW